MHEINGSKGGYNSRVKTRWSPDCSATSARTGLSKSPQPTTRAHSSPQWGSPLQAGRGATPSLECKAQSRARTQQGTQANLPYQRDAPQTPVQQARELVESYLNKVRDIGKEAVSQLESSELGKQLELKITEQFDTLSANALNLKKQLNPYVDYVKEQVGKELEKDIPIVKEKIRPALETFQKRWAEEVKVYQKKLTPLGAELHKKTKGNLDTFYKKLVPIAEELRDKLRTEVDSLRTNLAPQVDEVRQKLVQKLEEIKANAGPRAEAYKTQLSQQIENLKERFGPLAQNIRDRLLPHAEEAKSKLSALLEVVRARLGQAV
ncbi:uncharacterized protein WCC33_011523 [Rhinophrynus dorsalis]